MATETTIKEDNTAPIEFTIDANNISDLSNVSTAELYARKSGSSSNHVDGVSLSIKNSTEQTVEFDPVGNAADGGDAFDEAGVYKCYTKVTWTDGDVTRHPDQYFVIINVERSFE